MLSLDGNLYANRCNMDRSTRIQTYHDFKSKPESDGGHLHVIFSRTAHNFSMKFWPSTLRYIADRSTESLGWLTHFNPGSEE